MAHGEPAEHVYTVKTQSTNTGVWSILAFLVLLASTVMAALWGPDGWPVYLALVAICLRLMQ